MRKKKTILLVSLFVMFPQALWQENLIWFSLTNAGPEIGVASTKAFTTQLGWIVNANFNSWKISWAFFKAAENELITHYEIA